jgi:hypothetical protein
LGTDYVANFTLPCVLYFADAVEGFNLFKGLTGKNDELRSEKVDTGKDEDSVAVRRRKEIEREIEVIEVLQCTGVGVFCHACLIYVSMWPTFVGLNSHS